jgi:tRNA (guanosine-2'-O-)-methyltransferase
MKSYSLNNPNPSPEDIQALIDDFSERLTDRRRELLLQVLSNRTRHFTMVLEDLFDPHNISAVIRTSEVYGIQDVHIIEEDNPYKVNTSVLKGSFKWMNLFKYKKRARCAQMLRSKGYQIAVASTNTNNSVLDLDLSKPTAFYLGAEFRGNHPDTLEQADIHFKLPQYGVTESMNVSVAAGVLLTYLDIYMQKVGRSSLTVTGEERQKLLFDWYERSIFGTARNSPLCEIS